MSGVFNLDHPQDLLEKLARELNRLRESPDDVDHAFNFFVTAEHMLDWVHPGRGMPAKTAREQLRASDPILQATWDLATGAKHFRLDPIHTSVKFSELRLGAWSKDSWASQSWALGAWRPAELRVSLDCKAAEVIGPRITALALAEKVLIYWSESGRVPPRDQT